MTHQQQSQVKVEKPNKQLEENNKRAYELLLRIQSQVEASIVISTATKAGADYE